MKLLSRLKPLQVLALGYATVILMGSCLLKLPIATNEGVVFSFLDALFTSTSAACVTGLVVADTFTAFTGFGQAVILVLIQIGGLGFMVMITVLSIMLGRRIGLRERSLVMESISGLQIGGIVHLAKRVAINTAVIEFVGAALLSIRFCPMFGVGQGIWMSVFHSVSAFCNAGFDLMGRFEPFCSLTRFSSDALVILTVSALIVIGGLGFLVWSDVFTNRLRFKKYRLHTKIMLVTTLGLVLGGAALFLLYDNNAAFKDMGVGEKLLSALFQSISPRTAGFNSVPLDKMSDGGSLVTIILMFIGGGSGSTAGGIKVTTFAVAFLTVRAFVKRRHDIEIMGRRLEEVAPRKALSVIGLHMALALIGSMVVLSQGGITIKQALFECFSAIGTVGLTLGITTQLSALSQIVVMIMMYIGRVGSLTIAMAMSEKKLETANVRRMEEKIIIG